MIRIGVDHGMSGGLAVLKALEVVEVMPTPVVGMSQTRGLEFGALTGLAHRARALAEPDEDTMWIVERVHSMPKQGAASTFTFGRIVGQMEAFLAMSGIGSKHCTPYQWKTAAGMLKVPKEMSVGLCCELVPSSRRFLAATTKAKAIGIADAILIARFGWN